MKSSIERKVKYCMQQFEGDWTNYSGNGPVTIGPEWQTFTTEFKMEYPTDTKSRFNVTMGSIDGERISQQHDVFIDDISLIEIDEAVVEPVDPQPGDDPVIEPVEPQPGDDPVVEPVDPQPGDDPVVEPVDPQPGDDPVVEPENPDQPEPEPEPQPEPVIVIPPIIQIIAPVVKVVKKIVVTVFSILRRLFW